MSITIGPNDLEYEFKAGEALHSKREPLHVLERMRQTMGTAAFSAQYMQAPVLPGGDMIKWAWFPRYAHQPQQEGYGAKIVPSWDTASKSTQLNDYSVGITALVTKDQIDILDVVRARLEYPDLKRRIVQEKTRWRADTILIEDKGSGTSLIQDLKREYVHTIKINPESDKITRMATCTAQIEAGAVSLPMAAPWLEAFQAELMVFPKGHHDDQVDALSQLLNWVRTRSRYSLEHMC